LVPFLKMVGGSQIGRMAEEMGQKGKDAVEMEGWVKVNGRLDRTEMESAQKKKCATNVIKLAFAPKTYPPWQYKYCK
jgi:hypothetical protein